MGETEWHRSDGGAHNTHYMREGSSANNHGSVNMTHTNRQPLSEENALAMQRQDECLLAAQMSHVDLAEDQQLAGDDVGRTDSVRGVRGAMAPKHASAATLVGERCRLLDCALSHLLSWVAFVLQAVTPSWLHQAGCNCIQDC